MAYELGAADLMDLLGLDGDDWEIQDTGANSQKDYAGTKTRLGAHIAASETAHNERTDFTLNLKVKTPAGAEIAFTLGGAGTGTAPATVVITAFTTKATYNDNATISITAHRHDDETDTGVAAHLADPVAEVIELTLGFGIDAVLLGGTLIDCQSAELSGSVEHKDKYGNTGKFLVGASSGLKYEATEEYVDNGTPVTVAAPWKQDSQEEKSSGGDSPDFHTRTVKAHAYSLV
jgi:hypothetical protein